MAVLLVAGCTAPEPAAPTGEVIGRLAADQTDWIPSISYQDCLVQIKETNPEMTDQQAQDNCLTIEAINTNDSSLCEQVSETLRQNCLGQF
ncbi:MAG: hypothetical protein ACE5FW_01905 [Candidatus Aenigmatarchaeota archaeon]